MNIHEGGYGHNSQTTTSETGRVHDGIPWGSETAQKTQSQETTLQTLPTNNIVIVTSQTYTYIHLLTGYMCRIDFLFQFRFCFWKQTRLGSK